MKRFYALVFSSFSFLSMYAQLNADHNSLRANDVLVKQQVKYKSPGEASSHSVWDFSRLEPIDNEYTLSYTGAPLRGDSIYVMGYNKFNKKTVKKADLIVGTEHNTKYYFYQTLDSLLLMGHENVAIKQQNTLPLPQLFFPLDYGQEVSSKYQTKGMYSKVTPVSSEGEIRIHADAFGMMILPSGDTINPVLRVKTEQTIFDAKKRTASLTEDNQGRMLRSYKWYSKGYRYPIFETVESIDLKSDSTLFHTSFFFPPQEHLYLETDPENLALLDKLWGVTEEDFNSFSDVDLFIDDSDNTLRSRIYPNPVSDILHVEYTLKEDSPVNIMICTIDGRVVKNIYREQQQAGEQHEEIDCSHLMYGAYLIKIVAGEETVNGKILKK